jgi:hypothetical protein
MKGLREVVHRADGEAAHGNFDVRNGGDHDNGGVRPASANAPQQLESVHLRHSQVAHHERHRLQLQLRERLFAVPRFEAGEPIVPHQVHEHLTKPRLVIDDETVLCRVGFGRH